MSTSENTPTEVKLTTAQHLVLSAFWFATNFHWGAILLIVLPDEVQRLNPAWRAETLGWLTGFSAVVALLVPLIAGALSDRCFSRKGRRRPFIAVGVAVNVIGLIVMAAGSLAASPPSAKVGFVDSILQNPPFLLFTLGYLTVQLGNNIASAAYMGVIPDLVPPSQRGTASGYMALMTQAGTVLGGIVTGMVVPSEAVAVRYGALCLVLVIVAVLTWTKMHEVPLEVRPPKLQLVPYLKSLWIDPRTYPDFAWVWITRFLVMLGFYAVVPYINYYLPDVLSVPRDKVGLYAPILMAVILIAASFSGLQGGRLSDRIGRKKVVYIANTAIAVVTLGFIFARTLPVALGISILFGLGYGAYISVDYALGTDVLPSKQDAGKDMAVWHIAMTLPQTISASVSAFLIGAFGKTMVDNPVAGQPQIAKYPVEGYAAIFLFCSIAFGLGAYLLKNVKGVR